MGVPIPGNLLPVVSVQSFRGSFPHSLCMYVVNAASSTKSAVNFGSPSFLRLRKIAAFVQILWVVNIVSNF